MEILVKAVDKNIAFKNNMCNMCDKILDRNIANNDEQINNLLLAIDKRKQYAEFITEKIKSLNAEIIKITFALRKIDLNAYAFIPYLPFNAKANYTSLDSNPVSVEIKCTMIGRRKPIGDIDSFSIKKWQSVNRINKRHQDKVWELGYKIMINRYTLNNKEQVKVILYI